MYSKEFFIQRSFEVVWAVFRVAEHTTRQKIKQGLEDKAVDYLLAKDLMTLDGLEEVVRLSGQIKEINQINTSVLLREIGNLRAAMLELDGTQRKQLASAITPENAPKIEEVFSRPPMRVSDLIEIMKKSGFEIKESKVEEKEPAPKDYLEKNLLETNKSTQTNNIYFGKSPAREEINFVKEKQEEIKYEHKESGKEEINSPAREESPATANLNSPARQESGKEEIKSPASKKDRFEAIIGFKERNSIIMEVLNKRSLCHTKDLVDALPNISERTVRYDIQRLVDKGIIERVGTGGPNSFFRIKK